jgi:hypothetical protein
MIAMDVNAVRTHRERKEEEAALIAAAIPPGDYYASGRNVIERGSAGKVVCECETHTDAVRVLLRIAK